MTAWEITVWCETDSPDQPDLAAALEEGRLFLYARNVRYEICGSGRSGPL